MSAPTTNRSALWPLAFANFVVGVGVFVVIGVLAPITRDLGMSKAESGWAMGAYALAYALTSPLIIAASGRIDRRVVVAVGLGVFVLACAATALATSAPALFAARVLAALGAGVVTPVAAGIAVASAAPEERGKALSFVFTGMTFAQALGIPAGAWLGYAWGWRVVFWSAAVLSALAVLWVLARVPRGVAFQTSSLRQLARIVASPLHVVAATFTATFLGAAYVVYTFFGPLAEMRLNMGRDGVALMLAAYGAGAVVGNVAGGRMTDRLGPDRTLALIALAQIVLTPLVTLTPFGLAGGMALAFLWSLCGWSFMAPQQTRLITVDPQAQGVMLALNAASIYVGSAVGSVVGGFVYAHWGLAATGPAAAALCALALAQLLVSIRMARWEATNHLLRSPKNAERLLASIDELEGRVPTPKK